MKKILMLGTALDTRGGISEVVRAYVAAGLFRRWPIAYIATHTDGAVPTKLRTAAKAWIQFATLVMTNRVCLAHVHSASRSSFWRKSCFIVVAFAARLPVIFHLHGGGFETFYEQSGRIRRYFIRAILRNVHTLIALSETARQWLARTTGRGDILILPNPVSMPSGEHREASPPYILFMGRLSKEKGIFDLLETFAEARETHRSLRLVCAGEGDIAAVKARCQQLGIGEAVELPGWVEGDEKAALLAGAAVFVLPSYYEAMPVSLLEAMSWGVPVVATEVGAIPEILSCEGGVCIKPGDTEALTSALNYLMSKPDVRLTMGRLGKRSALSKNVQDKALSELERMYFGMGCG